MVLRYKEALLLSCGEPQVQINENERGPFVQLGPAFGKSSSSL
jgi:hypothetical protein